MKHKGLLIAALVIVIGIIGYIIYKKKFGGSAATVSADQVANMKAYLMAWPEGDSSASIRRAAIKQMNDADIEILYHIVHDYFNGGQSVTGDVQAAWDTLAYKYPGVDGSMHQS